VNWKSFLRRLRSSSALPPLPESFIFGVATSDHQCEAYKAEREDIRDVWERERGLTRRGKATNFEEHFEEDIRLAQKLGCTAFRFSVAWSRVEPSPGQFDDAMFDYYRRLVTAIHNAGMEPVLTLHHFTWPVHVEQRAGMIADDFPTMFAHYTAEVVTRLGKEVRYWITFNEPSQLVYGYIKPWWEPNYFVPPGLPEGATMDEQVAAIGKLIRNLFVAHTEARKIIRRGNPDAQVGANPLLLGLPIWLQRLLNKNATRIRSYADLHKSYRHYVEPRQLERGAVDFVIAALTRTPERERQVMFSQDYFVAGQRLLVKSSSTVTGAQDLASKVVAVVKGSTAEHSITTLMPEARVLAVRDYASALQALAGARADAILADDIILQGLIERHPDQYKLIGDQLTTEHYAVAVTQGHHQLLDVVDVVVRRFKNSGAWAEYCARHLGQVPETQKSTVRALSFIVGGPEMVKDASRRFDVPDGPLPLAPPGTALRRIQDRGYFIVAVREDMPGLSYRDPHTGEFSGLEIDLAREMAKQIFGDASKIQFRPARAHERISLLYSPLHFLSPLLKQYTIFSTILVSNWWHLGMAGKLAEFLCPKECVGQQDFVGLDYYWGIRSLRLDRLQRLIDAGMGRFDRAPVWPNALYGHLRYQASLFPDLPLLIAENGSVDVADGVDRATYIRQHIEQVLRAVRDGVNVVGYICWSITSNREWGYPFDKSSDFGLYHIELDKDPDLKRVPTPSMAAYKEIIAQRGVHSLAPRQHKTERQKQ
jgi:beta-glucosidase/6-phospho-beta-glucosidase/beta-galactosidase/ABC-type amino acid transport substrate-binding protein